MKRCRLLTIRMKSAEIQISKYIEMRLLLLFLSLALLFNIIVASKDAVSLSIFACDVCHETLTVNERMYYTLKSCERFLMMFKAAVCCFRYALTRR
jgi:hypothetical protein